MSDSAIPPPPPPVGGNPNEMRGVLLKEESRLGRKSWKEKYVIVNITSLKYFATATPDFSKSELPRKTLPITELTVSKLPVASKHYRPHSFRLMQKESNYTMTFSASHDKERDAWMEFFEMVGGSRTRMDTLIEEEVGKIKSEVGSRESILEGFGEAENAARAQLSGLAPSPSHPAHRLSGPPPDDEKYPQTTPASSNRRIFASRVYDLFIKGDNPAVQASDLEKLILHLDIESVTKTEDIVKMVDPVKTGFVQKDLFLTWLENNDSGKRTSSPGPSMPGGPASPVTKQFLKKPQPQRPLPPRPKLDVSMTINLLKFSNTPMSIHMLQTVLCKSINTTLMNPEWWKDGGSEKLVEPLMRVLGKVRMAEVGENREKDDGDEQAVYGREEPLVDLMVLLMRFLKHCLISETNCEILFTPDLKTDQHIAALFERPASPSATKLRVTAGKFLLELCANYSKFLPYSTVRSIVEVAAEADDQMKHVALECLRYLIVTRIEAVTRCNGIKVAFEAILDPSTKELSTPLMYSILHSTSSSNNRAFLRPNSFSPLFASFTDLDAEAGAERTQRWKGSERGLVVGLRTFVGVLLFASRPSYIPSLMGLISDDTVENAVQIKVLEVIQRVLAPCKQLNDYHDVDEDQKTTTANLTEQQKLERKGAAPINMIDYYTVLLCSSFVHCGLVRALTNLCVHDNLKVSQAALTLLAEFMTICSRVLPSNQVESLLVMPDLTYCATRVGGVERMEDKTEEKIKSDNNLLNDVAKDEEKKVDTRGVKNMLKTLEKGTKASAALRSLADELGAGENGEGGQEVNLGCIGGVVGLLRVSSIIKTRDGEGVGRRGRIMESLRQGLETGLDKRMLVNLIDRSNVDRSKEWGSWDWNTIEEILEDSLQNRERLSEALKTKFVKRLGGYFRCSPDEKGFFAHLVWKPESIVYMNCACRFYEVLLKHQEGVSFLKSDRRGKVFEEISKELSVAIKHVETQGLDSVQTSPPSMVFDRETVHRHMTREYFAILGRMWCTRAGEALLTDLKIFDLFTSLAKHQQLDYLSRIVLSNLDYNQKTPQSLILMYVQEAPSVSLRLHAVCVLRAIVRSRMKAFDWGIEILVTRLHQPDAVVNEVVLSVLNEAAGYPPYLNIIIEKRPPFIQHPLADALFEKFASVPAGIEFLTTQNKKWFERSIVNWKNERSLQYVISVEDAMANSLTSVGKSENGMPPLKIPLNAKQAIALEAHQERLAGKEMDLESLLRIPWTIDLVINQSKRSAAAQGKTVTLDTTLSVKDVNCVIISGRFVDVNGREDFLKCSLQDCIHSSLFMGSCPVKKDGSIGKPLQMWQNAANTNHLAAAFGVVERSSVSAQQRFRSASTDSETSSKFGTSGAGVEEDVSNCDWSTCTFQGHKIMREYSGGDVKISIPVRLPTHLFGELAKNEEGRSVLEQHRVINELAEVVREGLEEEENDGEFLGSLWSLANICSAEQGLDLVKNLYPDFIQWLCLNGYTNEDFSMRGTCICLLGLIAKTKDGRQSISEYGWVCRGDDEGGSGVRCPVPRELGKFFNGSVAEGGLGGGCGLKFKGAPARGLEEGGVGAAGGEAKSKKAIHIFNAIGKLGDHITMKEGMAALRKLRGDASMDALWTNDEVIAEVYRLMNGMRLGLNCRRFIRGELFEC
ncbi:hypothetical protein TL16_g12745 [Triparma laevis f. inornata]|uniref:PH domain-containing protein n=1 Tax=Triparma laevis f. inornata TaxID=1714386 RepID=A0A9W7EW18_9STRA|nr:hypothetical protein TL16_g12745 [Triparma laevis f. inornata]